MNYELKELTENLIDKELYNMYQDIPNGENGQTNLADGISYEDFIKFINKQIERKYNDITYDDTPTLTYIFYVNNKPVGYICLRTKIDDNWMKWSGNFYYQIRKSERRKGYATNMLLYALDIFRKMNYSEVYGNASNGNIGSQKVIENNGGIFLYEDHGSNYYKIKL